MEAVTITQITPPELSLLIENSLRKILSRQQPIEQPDGYITRQEAADILCITLPTLGSYTLEGKVKGYRIGRRVLYKKHEVEQATTLISTNKKTR
jgi:excisionase family DNA binding protein